MVPRLGAKHGIEIETVSRPRAEYQSPEYAAGGLPKAPAIMIGEQTVVQGRDVSELELEAIIGQRLARSA